LDLWPDGTLVRVAGLVLVRQRPGTATGICFITIEDETGTANLVVFKKLFDKSRKDIVRAKLLMVEGKIQREGEVTHVIAAACHDMSGLLQQLHGERGENTIPDAVSARDKENGKGGPGRHKKSRHPVGIQGEIFPAARDFK